MKNTNSKNSNHCESCKSCNTCYYCESCKSCESCYCCYSCDCCNYCNYCNSCKSCESCYYCESCYCCKGLRMSEHMLFCIVGGMVYQKNYMIFNQKVEKEEWNKIYNSLPDFNISLDKTLTYQDAWKEWLDNASLEEKKAILNCGYFDADIFKRITGQELTLEVEELTMDEVCKELGRNIKIKR